jgi:hypothetical protein
MLPQRCLQQTSMAMLALGLGPWRRALAEGTNVSGDCSNGADVDMIPDGMSPHAEPCVVCGGHCGDPTWWPGSPDGKSVY